MEIEDAKEALLQVARERLKLYPHLIGQFEMDLPWLCAVGGWRERLTIAQMLDTTAPYIVGPVALPRTLLAIVDEWAQSRLPRVRPLAAASPKKETAQERRARRWKMCVDAGLKMPSDTYGPYPRGYGAIGKREGVTRQSFKQDLDAHREKKFAR